MKGNASNYLWKPPSLVQTLHLSNDNFGLANDLLPKKSFKWKIKTENKDLEKKWSSYL